MRAEELMIGDWVKHHYLDYEGKDVYRVFKVSQIRTLFDGKYFAWSDEIGAVAKVKDLEPIPLTSEFLKENNIYAELGPGGLYQLKLEGINCRVECNIIRYVHQLQHALRIAGIEKEIEL